MSFYNSLFYINDKHYFSDSTQDNEVDPFDGQEIGFYGASTLRSHCTHWISVVIRV